VRPSPGSSSALRQFEHELARGLRDRSAGTHQQLRGLFVLLTATVLTAVVFDVVPTRGAVRVYLVVVVAAAAAVTVARALSRFGRLERRARRPRSRARSDIPMPLFFGRAERRLELASSSIAQFELLRPRLREVAEQRLALRGTRLESDASRRLLGETAWLLLDRRREGDKFAPGPRPTELRELIDALERI
jgi:hypothetical protein